jgi:hypothetical protein
MKKYATGLCVCLLLALPIGATEYFVATTGSDAASGLNWANPLLTISNAVAQPTPTIVTVSNGTYDIVAEIAITNGITVRSFGNGEYGGLTNAALTIVQRSSGTICIFDLSHADAVLNGITVRNGNDTGVYMSSGLVRDSIIRDNSCGGRGGGVYLHYGGTVSNCVLQSNTASSDNGGGAYLVGGGLLTHSLITGNSGNGGGGVAADGGRVFSCIISNNTAPGGWVDTGGGGVQMNSGSAVVRNCLIVENSAPNGFGGGVAILQNNALIESCTISGNYDKGGIGGFPGGGGIWCWDGNRGYIKNCIVYGNTSDDPTYKNIYHDGDLYRVTYTCTTNPVFIGNNCTSSDPLLTADYKLGVGSSCIDVGTNETWMIDVMDLGGNDRKIYGEVYGSELDPIVDMGTYEYLPTEPVTLRNLLVPVDREILRERNVFWP